MKTNELQSIIKAFVEVNFFVSMYAVLFEDEKYKVKNFQMDAKLSEEIKIIVKKVLEENILSDSFILDSIETIEDSKKTYYEINQSVTFNPFSFLTDITNIETYKEKDQPNLKGFMLRINRDDEFLWIYQHKYSTTLINRATSLFAILNGSVYEPLNCDVVKIDSRMDILIIKDSVITNNIKLLQSQFGFDEYIIKQAKATIEFLQNSNLIQNISKIIDMVNSKNIMIAKKLMKVKTSEVLKIPENQLMEKIKNHHIYKERIHIDETNNQIVLNSQKDIHEFFRMLNDDILVSELTNTVYNAPNKDKET